MLDKSSDNSAQITTIIDQAMILRDVTVAVTTIRDMDGGMTTLNKEWEGTPAELGIEEMQPVVGDPAFGVEPLLEVFWAICLGSK